MLAWSFMSLPRHLHVIGNFAHFDQVCFAINNVNYEALHIKFCILPHEGNIGRMNLWCWWFCMQVIFTIIQLLAASSWSDSIHAFFHWVLSAFALQNLIWPAGVVGERVIKAAFITSLWGLYDLVNRQSKSSGWKEKAQLFVGHL